MKVRCRWHPVAGILAPWFLLVHWTMPVLAVALYCFYQHQQDKNTGTASYLDIKEFTIPFYISCTIIFTILLL